MKKNHELSILKWSKMLTKRKSSVLMLFMIFLWSIQTLAGEGVRDEKLNIEMKNASLKELFDVLKQQAGLSFMYSNNDVENLDRRDYSFKGASLETVLNECLKSSGLAYVIDRNKEVVVIRKARSGELIIQIKGKVTDQNGIPLHSATVLIKGTLKGTTTDINGNYAIEVPENGILVFTFVGYQKQEIAVSAKKAEINVVMQEEISDLGEVAVISTGYQKIKPEQSTGSITTIRAKEFNNRINTTDFLTGLQNKIPGLLINNDVTFEGNSLFQIRGVSTINGDKSPLIVVDGFPTELSLDMINPNEIESVTVLKDAAAATVYGVRASNGVIVIERKQAKAGKPVVNFRITAGFIPKENYERYRWDKDASDIYINYQRESYTGGSYLWNLISHPKNGAYFNVDLLSTILAREAAHVITEEEASQQYEELSSYNNTKDYGRLFLRTASTQTYNLNISGGDKNVLYYITANYIDNNALEIKNDNNRFMLSGRTTVNFSKRFLMELTTDFQETKKSSVPIPDIGNLYPYERFLDEEGNPLSVFYKSYANIYYNDNLISQGLLDNMYYPLVDIDEIFTKTRTVNNHITVNFRYKIGYGFNLSFGGVYENSRTDIKYLASENSSVVHQYVNYYTEDGGDSGFIYNIPKGSFLRQSKVSTESYTLRAQLNYDKQISKDHSLNLILGSEVRDVLDKSSSAAYFGYDDKNLLQQPVDYTLLSSSYSPTYAGAGPSLSYSSLFNQGYEDNRYVSIYSNVVYAYKGRYSFTGSIRIDQSNLFGTDPKYKYKPLWSVGAAWNIHKEGFMQDVDWVKSLKLRMAYGFNGNVAKNSLPQVIAEAELNDFDPTEPTTMLSLSSFANSGLRWEQTRNFNIGLDFNILKNITASIDYYTKKSTDLLASNQIDASKGGVFAVINQASIRNNGLEISLHADWITHRNFNWNTGFVFSHNSSKVLQVYNELTESSLSTAYIFGSSNYLEGYAVGAMFNYRYAGLDSEGSILIYNKNGEAENISYVTDKSCLDYSGSSIPTINIGLSNRVDIGNFYVYCMINFYGGFKVRVPVPDPGDGRPLEGAGNYWREPGDEANPDVLPSPKKSYYDYLLYTDKYTVNGAYLTLGDLTVSYSFRDSKLVKKIGISNLEVRAQASNLFTVGFNKYNYSIATGLYAKSYLTPTYTIGLYVNF